MARKSRTRTEFEVSIVNVNHDWEQIGTRSNLGQKVIVKRNALFQQVMQKEITFHEKIETSLNVLSRHKLLCLSFLIELLKSNLCNRIN